MKPILLFLTSITLLSSCTSLARPKYITTCTEPACHMTAQVVEHQYRETEGIAVVFNNSVRLTVEKIPRKIAQDADFILLIFDDKTRIASFPVATEQLSLEDKTITAADFYTWVVTRDFTSLEKTNPSDQLLAEVGNLKLLVTQYRVPVQINLDKGTAFYYMHEKDTQHHQVIVTNHARPDAVTFIDVIGYGKTDFEQLVSTMKIR